MDERNVRLQISSFRKAIYRQLDPEAYREKGLSVTNKLISLLVVMCVISAILETEPLLSGAYAHSFEALNTIFLVVFTIEYLARIWAMSEREEYKGWIGRLRYALTFPALIDLLTVLPFWFGTGSEILMLRLLRLLRILKLARIPHVSEALKTLADALKARSVELALSVAFAFLLMIVAATTLYFLERHIQPDAFGSIPRALWWGMATLTTVGYGDIYPVTVMGKVAAGLYAFAGIGLVAMPTGIFAAAMSEIVKGSDRHPE